MSAQRHITTTRLLSIGKLITVAFFAEIRYSCSVGQWRLVRELESGIQEAKDGFSFSGAVRRSYRTANAGVL
mgnify:CR=1 FL=1